MVLLLVFGSLTVTYCAEDISPMQTIAAYLIFMLMVVALGLAVILSGVIVLAAYEGASWLRERLHSSQTLRSHSALAHR